MRRFWSQITKGGVGHTISMNAATATQMVLVADVFSGVNLTTPVGAWNQHEQTQIVTSWSGNPITTSEANNCIIGWVTTAVTG